jgi:ParB family chromosome partitioning protein
MSATLTMVPLAKIKSREGFNPRTEFADEQMAELVASVKRHGIITPLTLAPDGEGFAIIAGERRYRAAKAAKLTEVPAQVRDADGEALALAVAENVVRADLNPVEEARAYERLLAEHGDAAKVARLVGRSEKLVGERLDLLRLPAETLALLAARRVPLACAPALIRIASAEPLLTDLTAAWLADRPQAAARFPADPGAVVDEMLEAEWQDQDGQPLCPVAYSVGGYYGPLLPGRDREEQLPRILAKLADRGEPVAAAYAELPPIPREGDHDWQARQAEEQRQHECFALTEEDADAARAFGCLLELADPDGRGEHRYVTDRDWLTDRLVQKIAAHAAAAAARKQRASDARRPTGSDDDAEKEARRAEREREYEARTAARARNLDLGAALARCQPKLDTDAVKLLGSLVLIHYGRAAAWAQRLCVEHPTTTTKQGKVTVCYPRGAQAEKEHHAQALSQLMRARTPEDALAVVLRLLLAQRLVDTGGLPAADRQGVYEPQELAAWEVLDKLARRVAPPSVKQHAAAQAAERERREQAWRDEQAAKLAEQRAKLAAGEAIRCECCLQPITSPDDATEKHGTLVHKGDCERDWGSAAELDRDDDEPEELD